MKRTLSPKLLLSLLGILFSTQLLFAQVGSDCQNAQFITEGIHQSDSTTSFYKFITPSTGQLTVSSVGHTDADTYLEIYLQCGSDLLAFSDDAEGLQSKASQLTYAQDTFLIKWDADTAFVWNLSFESIEPSRRLDSLVLVDMYYALDGENWPEEKQWNLAENFDTWPDGPYYISNDRIYSLYFSGNHVHGKIPRSIGLLNELSIFGFSSNNVTRLPYEIDYLSSLRNMYLDYIDVDIILPKSFETLEQLSELRIFYEYDNQSLVKFPISITTLPQLKILSISASKFEDSLPTSIGNLKSLTSIYLDGEWEDKTFPISLIELKNLESLSVTNGNIEGTLPEEIGTLKNLRSLNLYSNKFTGDIPSTFNQLTNLQSLNLSQNNLTGGINVLAELSNLNILYLSDNQFTQVFPIELCNIIALHELDLSQNSFYGSIPKEIGNLKNLTDLYLKQNDFEGEFPNSFANNIDSLYIFNITQNRFTNIPDLTHCFDRSKKHYYRTVELKNNKLDFSSIFPNQALKHIINFSVHPQASIEIKNDTIWGTQNQPLEIVLGLKEESKVEGLKYNWYKNNNFFQTTNSDTLEIKELTPDMFGTYYCQIEHDSVPDFFLETTEIQIVPQNSLDCSSYPFITEGIHQSDSTTSFYKFIAPSTGQLTVSSVGHTDADTYLEIYLQCGGELLAYNDDAEGLQSKASQLSYAQDTFLIKWQSDKPFDWELRFESIEPSRRLDSLVLVDMYYALDGENWPDNNKWDFSTPIDSWAGIYFLGTNDRVDRLYLWESFEYGKISRSIGFLEELRDLRISYAQHLHELPNQTKNLSKLTNLEINNIPEHFLFPDSLIQLKNLSLSFYNSNSHIPSFVNQLSSLKQLFLNNLTIYDDELNGISNIPLSHLRIKSCNLNNMFPKQVTKINTLEILYLTNCEIKGQIPQELNNLTKLEQLFIYENEFNGIETGALSKLNDLMLFDADHNNLTFDILDELSNLNNLQILDLGFNNFSGALPASINKLANLGRLSLYKNNVSTIESNSLSLLPELYFLDLSYNNLVDTIPSEIFKIEKLRTLSLNNNNLKGEIPSSFKNLKNITSLDLSNNKFFGKIPDFINDWSNLQTLKLGNNEFEGDFPQLSSDKMTRFDVHNNRFTSVPLIADIFKSAQDYSVKQFKAENNRLSFSSLIPNFNFKDGIYDFSISPQKSIPFSSDSLKVGREGDKLITWGIDKDVTGSTYKWFRGGSLVATTSTDTLFFTEFDPSLSGTYHASATNVNVPDLTLYSDTVFVEVQEVSGSDCESAQFITEGIHQSGLDTSFYKFIAPSTGQLTVSSVGHTDADTYLEIYLQCGGDLLAFSDDAEGLQSKASELSYAQDTFLIKWDAGSTFEWNLSFESIEPSRRLDSLVLVDMYHNLNGENWSFKRWDSLRSMNYWNGIGLRDERVQYLTLYDLNLSGQLPRTIGLLSKLRSLYIRNTSKVKGIPEEIIHLSKLEYLYLYQINDTFKFDYNLNLLKGIKRLTLTALKTQNEPHRYIPDFVKELTNIETLSLGNYILLEEDLNRFLEYSITGLTFDQCNLGTKFPLSVTRINELTQLGIIDCNIDGDIPAELSKLKHLSYLDLSKNKLVSISKDAFPIIGQLHYLNLSNNEIRQELPDSLFRTSDYYLPYNYHLFYLNLSNNEFYGKLPSSLSSSIALYDIFVDNNNFEGSFPNIESSSIYHFKAEKNNFTTFPNIVEKLSGYYSTFHIDNNKLTFSSILLNLNKDNTLLDYSISPQKNIPFQSDSMMVGGEGEQFITWGIDKNVTGSTYEWFRGDSLVATTSTDTLFFTEFDPSLSGGYHASVTNVNVPDLTLYSDTVFVEVEEVKGLDCESAQFIPEGIYQTENTLVYYKFVAPSLGNLVISSVYHTDADTELEIYKDCESSLIAYNDDSDGLQSESSLLTDVQDTFLIKWASDKAFQWEIRFEPLEHSRKLDSLVLVDFYHATNGDEWVKNNNWLSTNPIDNWLGISTSSSGRVKGVDFINSGAAYNNLYGVLPNSIQYLSEIEIFNVRSNELYGSLPEGMRNWSKLKHLDIVLNNFEGNLPEWISELTNLETLEIGANKFTGSIPESYGKLINLQDLRLFVSDFEGPIPESFGNLKKLKILHLFNNKLSGKIPSSIGNLINLVKFEAENNKLEGNIPTSIGKLSNLQKLELYNNELTGKIPSTIGQLQKLNWLELSTNQLNGNIPDSITYLDSLEYLFLNKNHLTGSIPNNIGNLKKINTILLNDNFIEGEVPESLNKLKDIKYFQVYNNKLHHLPKLTIFHNFDDIHMRLYIKSNFFTFEDFTRNSHLNIKAGLQAQKTIPFQSDSMMVGGEGDKFITWGIDKDVAGSTYEWFRGDSLVATTSTDTLFFTEFDPSLSGEYHASATNVNVPDLTLFSDTVFVEVQEVAEELAFYRAVNLAGEALTIDGYDWESNYAADLAIRGSSYNMSWLPLNDAPADANKLAMLGKALIKDPNGAGADMLNVPEGTYSVYLYVMEWEGNKQYDIKLNGEIIEDDFGLEAKEWKKLGPWEVAVTDGKISIETEGGKAALCGLEVWSGNADTPEPGDTIPPTVPENLRAENIAMTSLKLLWDASADETALAGYEVYQDGQKLGEELITETELFIDSLEIDTEYKFIVLAKDSAGNSSDTSGTLTISTLPPLPTVPTAPSELAVAETDGQLNFTWTDNSDNELGFVIEKNSNGNFELLDSLAAGTSSYNHAISPANDTLFTFRVKAWNNHGESEYSNEVDWEETEPTGINLESGLVVYYPFDGDTKDYSTNQQDGTPANITFAEDKLGNASGAAQFDGTSSYIDCGYHPDLKRYSSDFSINVWVKLNAYSEVAGSVILSNRANGTPFKGSSPAIEGKGNATGQWGRPALTVKGLNESSQVMGNQTLSLDAWYMVTYTFNYNSNGYNTGKVYINGVLSGSNSLMENVIDPGFANTYIGFEPTLDVPNGYHFNGAMDEMRVYDRELNEEEIQALHDAMNQPVEEELELYRAVNLAGEALTIDELDFESGYATNLAIRGSSYNMSWIPLNDAPAEVNKNTMLGKALIKDPSGAGMDMLNIPEGTYSVYLYVMEWEGNKQYDIKLNGEVVADDFGLEAKEWRKLGPWEVDVTDGKISIETEGGKAAICGLEVWKGTGTPAPKDTTPPSTPRHLSAKNVTYNSLTLIWESSTDDVALAGYDVFEGSTKLNSELVTDTVFDVTDLSEESEYIFKVYAKDEAGNRSETSDTAWIFTPAKPKVAPAAPSGLVVTKIDDQLELTWSDNSDNELGFVLESKTYGNFTVLDSLGEGFISYIMSTPTDSVATFRLKAWNNTGESSYSNIATWEKSEEPEPPTEELELYRAVNLGGEALTIEGNPWEATYSADLVNHGGSYNMGWIPLNDAPTEANKNTMLGKALIKEPEGSGIEMNEVPNGEYQVYLYVMEWEGNKQYDIKLNGKIVEDDFGLEAKEWRKLGPWDVDVTDGSISIETEGGEAALSGLEVWAKGSFARKASIGIASGFAPTFQPEFNSYEAYPNPTSGLLNIESPQGNGETLKIRVTDYTGKLILEQDGKAGELITIDLSTAPSGMLLIQLVSDQGTSLKKVLKQ
ncbi:leucine-rich repeat domain-containing protein [Flammeovirgaceae bacterium SG7u.111]|nr:leucine-rich repeat domain-containing protein [Flammeovirgaceae bacterium SG7u.132]WPO37398.1 leucine-rich repeat domain-containing protein [Flammeovirgaceae bacterium SG7u.111]